MEQSGILKYLPMLQIIICSCCGDSFNLRLFQFFVKSINMKDVIYKLQSILQTYYNMTDQKSQSSQSLNVEESSSNVSPQKSELQLRRQRKKQFQTFLNPIESSPLPGLPKRKLSGDTKQKQPAPKICNICNFNSNQSSRQCDFCKQTVCLSHLRKRRRNRQTNKFNRICDHCEDRYLIEKHLKNQLKIEQSLVAQQLIMTNKHQEIKEILNNKRVRLQVQENKKRQLLDNSSKEYNLWHTLNDQLEKKTKKLEAKTKQYDKLEISLIDLEKSLPPSLQSDYNYLVQQNDRITKDLVKYQKLCNDAIHARSHREKKMYEEYYRWQFLQRKKQQKIKEQDECDIY